MAVRGQKKGGGGGREGEERGRERRKVGLHFFSSIKLLWRVFGTVSERHTYKLYNVNTLVELSRAFWNSQSALVSIRILSDIPSPPPTPFFVLEPSKRDLGTRSDYVLLGKVLMTKGVFVLIIVNLTFVFKVQNYRILLIKIQSSN